VAPQCDFHELELDGGPQDFEHTSTSFVSALGDAHHRGQDVIVATGQPQVLIGKFAYGGVDKDLKDEWVDVYAWREADCAWQLLGAQKTSDDGDNGTQFGVEDDGGRIFFTVDAAEHFGAGRHPVRMVVRGDHSMAAFDVYVVAPNRKTVVFDIDGTLTIDDFQIVADKTADLLGGTYVPVMHEGGVEVVQAYVDAGWFIVYVTGRPDVLRDITEEWLADMGFPEGALHTTDTLGEALPTEDGVGAYKTAFLQRLLGDDVQADIQAVYGNAPTDITAYEAVGIPKAATYIIGPHAGEGDTGAIDSYVDHVKELTEL